MPDLETKLHTAISSIADDFAPPDSLDDEVRRRVESRSRRRRDAIGGAVALVALGLLAAWLGVSLFADDSTDVAGEIEVSEGSAAPDTAAGGGAGSTAAGVPDAVSASLFSEPTGVNLLLSDGLAGVIAVDPDRSRVSIAPITGEVPGDQPYGLTRVDDELLVGWGEIWAAPLDGSPEHLVGQATIYVPAVEPGRLWLIDYPGRSPAPPGTPPYRLVGLDGTEYLQGDGPSADVLTTAIGIPGGLAFATDEGLVLWDAATDEITRTVGSTRSSIGAATSEWIAWCEALCDEMHLTRYDGTDHLVPNPSGTHTFAAHTARFSPDGTQLAVLAGNAAPAATPAASIVVIDLAATPSASVVANDLPDLDASMAWAPDGHEIFWSSYSYRQSSTTIGRVELEGDESESVTIPVGGAVSKMVVVDSSEAARFHAAEISQPEGCQPPDSGPSETGEPCTVAVRAVPAAAAETELKVTPTGPGVAEPGATSRTAGSCLTVTIDSVESPEACIYFGLPHQWRVEGVDLLVAAHSAIELTDGTRLDPDESGFVVVRLEEYRDRIREPSLCLESLGAGLGDAVEAEMGVDPPPFAVTSCSRRYAFVHFDYTEDPDGRDDSLLVFEALGAQWRKVGEVDFDNPDREERCAVLPDETGPNGETSARDNCVLLG